MSSRVAAVIVDQGHYMSKWYVELYFYEVCIRLDPVILVSIEESLSDPLTVDSGIPQG